METLFMKAGEKAHDEFHRGLGNKWSDLEQTQQERWGWTAIAVLSFVEDELRQIVERIDHMTS